MKQHKTKTNKIKKDKKNRKGGQQNKTGRTTEK